MGDIDYYTIELYDNTDIVMKAIFDSGEGFNWEMVNKFTITGFKITPHKITKELKLKAVKPTD